MQKNIEIPKGQSSLLHFNKASASNSFGFKRDLLGGIMRSVELNLDSIAVDAGRRQKIPLANSFKIGNA